MSQTLHKFPEDFSVVKSTVMNMLALHVSSNKESCGGWYWRISTQITNRQFSKASGKIHGSQGCVRNNTLSLQQQIRFSVLAMKLLSITHLTCQAANDLHRNDFLCKSFLLQFLMRSTLIGKIQFRKREEKRLWKMLLTMFFLVYLGFVFLSFVCFLFCCCCFFFCLHFGGGTVGQKILSYEGNLDIPLNVSLEQTWPLSS